MYFPLIYIQFEVFTDCVFSSFLRNLGKGSDAFYSFLFVEITELGRISKREIQVKIKQLIFFFFLSLSSLLWCAF